MSSFTTLKSEREPDHAQPIPPRRSRGTLPPEEEFHSRRWLWLSILALAVGLLGGGWFGFYRMDKLDNLVARLNRMPAELSAVVNRMGAAEQRLAALPGLIESLRGEFAALNGSLPKRLSAGLEQTRTSVRDLGSSLRKEMRDTMADQRRIAEERFSRIELERQAESKRADRLEQQVVHLNQRLTAVTEDLNHVQNAAALESRQLGDQIRRTDDRVTQVASFNNRPRDRFEAGKGSSVEISPGIILHITRVDPRYRRFHGWLQLVNDGKILWLRDQSMLQTVAFYTGRNALRHDLIVTGLNPFGVSGYLIHPSKGESQSEELVARARM